MKSIVPAAFCLFGILVVVAGCKKAGPFSENDSKNDHHNSCTLNSISFTTTGGQSENIFTSLTTGNVKHVNIAVFSGGWINYHLDLDIYKFSKSIAFVQQGTADTILKAGLNGSGRIAACAAGNKPEANFLPTQFEYTNERLSSMTINGPGSPETSRFYFDNSGNCTSIQDDPAKDVLQGGRIEYEYGQAQANQQFYLDEPRKFSWNSFTLLECLGYFPELSPVNIRTRTKVWWENNYMAYDMKIIDHQFDQSSKLISYQLQDPVSGNAFSKYSVSWNCNSSVAH